MVSALFGIVSLALSAVQLLVIAAIIVSWIGVNPDNPIVRFLRAVTEPLFALVRPLARKIPGPLDWSPAIVLLAIGLIRRYLL